MSGRSGQPGVSWLTRRVDGQSSAGQWTTARPWARPTLSLPGPARRVQSIGRHRSPSRHNEGGVRFMSRYDVGRVLAENPLPSVLRRGGHSRCPTPGPGVREEWRCHCPLPSHPAPADPARHKPSFAAHISGRMAGRWHCFACQTGGDAIAFVEAFAGVGFTAALRLLEGRGPLPRGADPNLHIRPVTRDGGVGSRGTSPPGRSGKRPALLGLRNGACTRRWRWPGVTTAWTV